MASKTKPITTSNFRGHDIAIYAMNENEYELRIDKETFHYTQTEDGVHSHECMYKPVGSGMELAEIIIKQRGHSAFK